jgi:RNA polymerase sigma-70 factor (ECF subfamily)
VPLLHWKKSRMAGRNSDARVLAALEHADPGSVPATVPSFQELYAQYFEFVWTSARRQGVDVHAIDDVVQEVFIVIHSRLHTLQQPEALRSWIYGVVRRTASNHHRSRRTRAGAGTTAVDGELESPQPTPFEITQKNADLELLAKLLAELDEPKREVFALVELDEMTMPEVAEALDIPLNTAYSRLRAARLAFEAALARHEARGEGR